MKTQIAKIMRSAAIVGLMVIVSSVCHGQAAGNKQEIRDAKKEKIQAQKVAFITQELQLSPQEAEKFWPVYNEFKEKKDGLTKTKREAEKDARKTGLDQISDKQAEELIASELKYEQGLVDLKKEYAEKFKKLVGPKKTVKLYQAEKQFNTYLLKLLKDAGNPPENE